MSGSIPLGAPPDPSLESIVIEVSKEYLGLAPQARSKFLFHMESKAPNIRKAKEYEKQEIASLERPPETLASQPCINCRGKNVVFYTAQLRRADEGLSVKYTCIDCGTGWRKG